MVHSFWNRIFSLAKSVKNSSSGKRSAGSVSLDAVIVQDSGLLTKTKTQSMDSSQVVTSTRISKKDFDSENDSPTFFLTHAKQETNNNLPADSSNSKYRAIDDGSENAIPSSRNWSWCETRNKDYDGKKSLRECDDEDEDDEEISGSSSGLDCCVNSRKFRLHGDVKLTRSRKCWFYAVVGLLIALILATTLTGVLIIVNNSSSLSLQASHSTISHVNNQTSTSNYNEIVTLHPPSTTNIEFSTKDSASATTKIPSSTAEDLEASKLREAERKRKISRLSWDLINKKSRNHRTGSSSSSSGNSQLRTNISDKPKNNIIPAGGYGNSASDSDEEVILPPKMVYTSSEYHLRRHQHHAPKPQLDESDSSDPIQLSPVLPFKNMTSPKSCCKTQKYSQTIKHEGCQPVTFQNRMCIGQCVSVWVPGLFASFPVCKPSRTVWKTLKLKCGPDGSKIQKVRVERVRRCSCMQIEPNNPGRPQELFSEENRKR